MTTPHRERVLRAATSSFLARGYGSSIDDIARRAGVARQTVYQHFASKDELFKAVAGDLAKRVLVELEGEDVRRSLLRFGLEYRKRALGAQGIATFRTLVPEVPRFRVLWHATCTRIPPAKWCAGLPSSCSKSSTCRIRSSRRKCCSRCSPAMTA